MEKPSPSSPKTALIGLLAGVFTLIAAFAIIKFNQSRTIANPPQSETATAPTAIPTSTSMQITSPAFEDQKPIPPQYTCDGTDVSPPLNFSGIPPTAKSLALIVHDPDAPSGDWIHWTLWNIPPQTQQIAENNSPSEAVQGITDFKKPGYGGPCPPFGTHRYQFELYALDTQLQLDPSASLADLQTTIQNHILSHAQLTGFYKRT